MNESAVLKRHQFGFGAAHVTLLALALLLPPAVVFGQGDNAAKKWTSFETVDQSALPIVRVGLNGSGPYHRFVLDAGFTEFILDPTLIAGMGLELASRNEEATIDFYGRPEKVKVAYLQELELGGATFQMLRTLLVEGEDGTGTGGIRSYGRIGRDVLEPLRLTVHYPRRLFFIEASPKDDVPEGGVVYRSEGRSLVIPVTLSSEGTSQEGRFVVDGSSAMSLLDRKWALRHGFATKDESQARIPAVEVGGYRTEELPFFLGEMKDLPYEGQPIGVIGADHLLGISVTYDFPRDRLWFVAVTESKESTESESESEPSDRSEESHQ